jgi:hypothetical protein
MYSWERKKQCIAYNVNGRVEWRVRLVGRRREVRGLGSRAEHDALDIADRRSRVHHACRTGSGQYGQRPLLRSERRATDARERTLIKSG